MQMNIYHTFDCGERYEDIVAHPSYAHSHNLSGCEIVMNQVNINGLLLRTDNVTSSQLGERYEDIVAHPSYTPRHNLTGCEIVMNQVNINGLLLRTDNVTSSQLAYW